MPPHPFLAESSTPALETFLLGRVPYMDCLELQQRLRQLVARRDDGQIILLFCEHPEIITIGRGGSPGQIARQSGLFRSREIPIHWSNRGGGCLLHCPGQLAIYPIVPLRWHGLTVGRYIERLRMALALTLEDLGARLDPDHPLGEIWGRTGQLASLGIAVRNGVAWHGAFLNVCPSLGLFRLIETDRLGRNSMSSLVAERCGPVRMPTVRAVIVRRLAESLGCERHHLYTGHPWLKKNDQYPMTND